MIVYVNGDSHSAGAEAVNSYSFAEDDGLFYGLGRQPHPDNERASYGCELANCLNAILYCDAESAASNSRIMRTARAWMQQQSSQVLADTFMVLQWSTWEREEWLHNNVWYQVNASGIDDVPEELQQQYKQYVANVDWNVCRQHAHDKIWQFHQELDQTGIKHVMFNGNNHFDGITKQHNWGGSYMHPYSANMTYDSVLKNNGFSTVNPNSWHFGAQAHCFWAEHVLQYIKSNNLL